MPQCIVRLPVASLEKTNSVTFKSTLRQHVSEVSNLRPTESRDSSKEDELVLSETVID